MNCCALADVTGFALTVQGLALSPSHPLQSAENEPSAQTLGLSLLNTTAHKATVTTIPSDQDAALGMPEGTAATFYLLLPVGTVTT